MSDKLKILIVDDNSKSLEGIKETIDNISGVAVSDVAKSNRMAKARLKYQPVDIVLLSLSMSGGNSLETIRDIRTANQETEVVVMSPPDLNDAKVTIQALELGALEHVKKPTESFSPNEIREFRLLLIPIFGLVQNRKNVRRTRGLIKPPQIRAEKPAAPAPGANRTLPKKPPPVAPPADRLMPKPPAFPFRIDVVAIAVSTGGPNALAKVIPHLPGDLGIPILLVQHMPATLTASLAESLNARSALTVREAVHGESVLPNVVYLAPGGKHMVVDRVPAAGDTPAAKVIGLNEDPPQNSVRPSADVLFESVARVYGGNILAVVMTGMGCDGLKGVTAMKQATCHCLTQSEETCVVYGMPRAIDDASLTDETVALEKLADSITRMVRKTG